MNSKQRRQLERKTKFKVTLAGRSGEDWMDYDHRVEKAIAWCKKKSKGEYVILNRFSSATFKFQKESDAVHFGLMWI
jgi:hypothetical protein